MLSSMNSKRLIIILKWRHLRREREGRRSCRLIRTLTPIRKMRKLLHIAYNICFIATIETIERIIFCACKLNIIYRSRRIFIHPASSLLFVISRAPKSNKWKKGSISRVNVYYRPFKHLLLSIEPMDEFGWVRIEHTLRAEAPSIFLSGKIEGDSARRVNRTMHTYQMKNDPRSCKRNF